MMNTENKILSPEDVMRYLNIGRNAIYTLLNTGELKGFRIGRKWKIARKDLEEYIENHTKYKH